MYNRNMIEISKERDVVESLLCGCDMSKILTTPALRNKYNSDASKFNLEQLPESVVFTHDWLLPDEFKNIDILDYFSKKVASDAELQRVAEEIDLFLYTKNENLLRYMIYLGEIIKENNIVVGVGRGSSVSVYLLYLCGIHKVNSLKYNLDYKEFFKIKKEK